MRVALRRWCTGYEAPVTWLFEPESFAPLAKLVGPERFGIVTDHLGTPTQMFDAQGVEVWAAEIDTYGELHNVRGERLACPFRWPGQYEDGETGLYYNRFRYYDRDAGSYISQDPLRLLGGDRLYAYTNDPTLGIDPLGLVAAPASLPNTPGVLYNHQRQSGVRRQRWDWRARHGRSNF